MPDERLTKNDKREQAREAARVAREKRERHAKLRRILIPSGVTVALLAIAAIVILVVSTSAPAPQSANGPKNMISDGILLAGSGGAMVATPTAAVKAGKTPVATVYKDDGLAHITTYVDFTCPVCQSFEAANSAQIEQLVESGQATLEVHPIAILDRNFLGSRYSSRANNVGACVANYAPDNFYAVMQAMYTNQGTEQTTGLTNNQMVNIVHDAGLRNGDVDKCITGETFKSWVASATTRATSDSSLVNPSSGGFGTPTVLVNGQMYTGSISDPSAFASFVEQVLAS